MQWMTPFFVALIGAFIFLGKMINKVNSLEKRIDNCQGHKICVDGNGQPIYISKSEHELGTQERTKILLQKIDKIESTAIQMHESQTNRIVNLEKKIDVRFADLTRAIGRLEGKLE